MKGSLACVGVAATLLLSGCYGEVSDPTGEDYAVADVDLAGVDHRTNTTRLFQRYDNFRNPEFLSMLKRWNISTNGDTNAELLVYLAGYSTGLGPDDWRVYRLSSTSQLVSVCEGRTVYGGYDGADTISLTIPSSCIATGGRLPDTVRIQAGTDADRSGNDYTGWTAAVGRD